MKMWSPEARLWLEQLETQLDALAADEGVRAREEDEARDRTEQAEDTGQPGIYVYALPHYLRYPYDPERGHTLLKVGRSQVDVYQRTAHQKGQRLSRRIPCCFACTGRRPEMHLRPSGISTPSSKTLTTTAIAPHALVGSGS
uniref:Uncharacterized protein n=2 Tax=Janibacter limosus TaxID=53458 RepID=A0AC61U7R9_9MICO|nr:hypothetical protein [Janibacter limosus]